MAQIMTKVRNIRTGREYLLSEEGWANIVKQGWEGRYEVLDRRQLVSSSASSYIPAEIGEAASAAAKALEAGEQLERPSVGSQSSDNKR
jgi:hypothetical protein